MLIHLFYLKRYGNEKKRFGTIFFSAIKESSGTVPNGLPSKVKIFRLNLRWSLHPFPELL